MKIHHLIWIPAQSIFTFWPLTTMNHFIQWITFWTFNLRPKYISVQFQFLYFSIIELIWWSIGSIRHSASHLNIQDWLTPKTSSQFSINIHIKIIGTYLLKDVARTLNQQIRILFNILCRAKLQPIETFNGKTWNRKKKWKRKKSKFNFRFYWQ